MINAATAAKIYSALIDSLKLEIPAHINRELYQPGQNGEEFQTGTAAFCRAYGINRTSLVRALSGNNERELSVGLYQRIAVALGYLAPQENDTELERLSLRVALRMDGNAIKDSIITINNL